VNTIGSLLRRTVSMRPRSPCDDLTARNEKYQLVPSNSIASPITM
jgi:hypothetical protein